MKDNQKTKKQLIDELDMLRQKMAAFEIAGSLRDASKAQQEDNTAKPKRKESRSFQEEKLNFVIEEAGLTSWDWDIEHDRKVFNPIWARMLGYTPEEFTSAIQNFSIAYFQHPEDIPVAQQAMKDCLTGKTSIYKAEYRMRTKTGDWKWMLALGKIIARNAEGKPTHITGVNLDISERKQAEEQIRRSERELKKAQSFAHVGSFIWDIQNNKLTWSDEMHHIHGIAKGSFSGSLEDVIVQAIHPDDRQKVEQANISAIRDKKPVPLEYRVIWPDKTIRVVWAEAGELVLDETGSPSLISGIVQDITERKRVEEALREKTRLNQTLLDAFPCVALLLHPQSREIIASNAAAVKAGAVPGTHCFSTWGQRQDPCPWCLAPALWATGEAQHLEVEALGIFWDAYWIPMAEDIYMYFAFDITARKRAEEALGQSEERFRTLVENIPGAVYRGEPTLPWRNIYFSNEIEVITGYPVKVFLENPILINDITLPEDLDMVNKVMETSIAGRQPFTIEYRIRHADGSIRWVYEKGRAIYSEQGQPLWSDGVYMDITERKRVEEALLLDSQMMANMADGVYLTRASDGVIVHANNQFEEMFGYGRGELIGKHVSVVNAPSDKTPQETAKEIIEALNRNRVWEGEIHNIKKDGTTFWCRASVTTFEHSSYGTVWISVHHDITERKRAEEALGQSEERFRTLVENIPGAVYRCEPTPPWRTIYFSNETEVITGYPVKVLLENPILTYNITLPEDLEMVNKELETSIAGRQPYTIEYRIRHADGSIRWVYEKGRAVYSEQGEPLWLDGVYMDITERKRTDEALREAQKLANIVTLAAGMAHEINSPLQVITGLTERITAQLESNQLDQSKLPRDIANINRLGWRIAHIIRSLLTYVSEMRGQVAPHDFNEIIKDTLLLTEPQLKTWLNVNVLTDLGENLPPLFCERNQIVQTLINLLTNAHDAMPNGGEISIHTRYDADGKRFALQVSDTGSGIPKAIQKKIFDPFFTTKEVGQGTGLGLSMVFGVVKAHGGEIEVESAPKQGTTFTIYLPKEPIQKPVSEPRAKNHGRY